jgi:hypothetical protein
MRRIVGVKMKIAISVSGIRKPLSFVTKTSRNGKEPFISTSIVHLMDLINLLR